jgi:hypothetical protein
MRCISSIQQEAVHVRLDCLHICSQSSGRHVIKQGGLFFAFLNFFHNSDNNVKNYAQLIYTRRCLSLICCFFGIVASLVVSSRGCVRCCSNAVYISDASWLQASPRKTIYGIEKLCDSVIIMLSLARKGEPLENRCWIIEHV